MNAIYLMIFEGAQEASGGLVYIGKGVVAGADLGLVTYDGTYALTGDRVIGQVLMKGTRRHSIGNRPSRRTCRSKLYRLAWTSRLNFANGLTQHVRIAGQHVAVTFRKIRDIPA